MKDKARLTYRMKGLPVSPNQLQSTGVTLRQRLSPLNITTVTITTDPTVPKFQQQMSVKKILSQNFSHKILFTKCQSQNFSHKISVTKFHSQNFSHKISVTQV